MPIVAYTGLPRHGKSHSAVEHVVLPALRGGRCVVTNLALHVDIVRSEFSGCDVRMFDIDAVKANPNSIFEIAPPGCVLLIDEAWKLWPAGTSVEKVPEAFKSILAEHGHRVDEAGNAMQIVLVTQDLMQIASFARQLVEQTFRTVKQTALGLDKRFRVDVYTGPAIGPNPPERKRVSQLAGKYRKEIWKYYKSHTMSLAGSDGANEKSIDKRIVVWRSPWFMYGVPFAIVLLAVAVWRVLAFFNPEPQLPKSGPAPQPRQSMARVVQARVESSWRIAGSVLGGGRDIVYFSDGQYYVSVDVADYCDRDVSGFLICTWRGQRITNQLKELPRYVSAETLSRFGQPLVSAQFGAALVP